MPRAKQLSSPEAEVQPTQSALFCSYLAIKESPVSATFPAGRKDGWRSDQLVGGVGTRRRGEPRGDAHRLLQSGIYWIRSATRPVRVARIPRSPVERR